MDPMPLAGAFAATKPEAEDATRYPLEWRRCRACGLVNVWPDVPDELIYQTYSYRASTVPALVRHHAAFAALLASRYPPDVRLLEIGSNDGVLIHQLPPTWKTVGVDPSDVARDAGYDLVNEPFTSVLARDLGTFDVVTSSNAFAHFTGIGDALDGVAHVLQPGGDFWLEVHDLDATLGSCQWDTIYHEHKVEWSLDSLRRAVEPRGFELVELTRLPLHGGLLRARFRRGHPSLATDTNEPDFEPLRRAYRDRQWPPLRPGSAAYGAAARASVYLNQMPGLPIAYVVDGSPTRAGRYVPGVALPIVSPEAFGDPPETLITAWNHAEDIKARHPGYDRWVTAW
jgi:SAM-dependent methyltransferase